MSTSDTAIETHGLTKHYGDVAALVDLDLAVMPGEVFGFLGPNGSGKTTMIRTILDEIRPTAGTASIVGLDSHRDAVEIRHHIGYVPGDLALYPDLTGRDTITFFANLRGGVDWSVVEELAERLDADLSKKVSDLSTGNRQKVGLIQAFMNEPDVLIMDEPSIGLDPLVQREFHTMVREVADSGRSVFLSSHTLSEVQRVADRVGIIRHGRLATVEALHDLRAKALRRVELDFAAPGGEERVRDVPGVRDIDVAGERVTVAFAGEIGTLLAALAGGPTLLDITTREADLEEIFLTFYRDQAETAAAPGSRRRP